VPKGGRSHALDAVPCPCRQLTAERIGSAEEAVYVLDANPQNRRLTDPTRIAVTHKGVDSGGRYYVSLWKQGLGVLDITNPQNLQLVEQHPTFQAFYQLALAPDQLLFAAEGQCGVRAFKRVGGGLLEGFSPTPTLHNPVPLDGAVDLCPLSAPFDPNADSYYRNPWAWGLAWDDLEDPNDPHTTSQKVYAQTKEDRHRRMHLVTLYRDLNGSEDYGGKGYGMLEFVTAPKWRGKGQAHRRARRSPGLRHLRPQGRPSLRPARRDDPLHPVEARNGGRQLRPGRRDRWRRRHTAPERIREPGSEAGASGNAH